MQFGLGVVQSGINAILCKQCFVGTLLLNNAIADDQNSGGIADGGKAVGNDQAGAVLHQGYHSLLDVHFGSGIYRGGCFVQNQDLEICQYGTAYGKKLSLPLAQVAATF